MENNLQSRDKESKRLFIGISLSEEICNYFYDLMLNLSKINKDIQPIPPQNIHITLKFLGNVKESDLESITANIKLSLKESESFKFNIENSLDGFPRLSASRIIFGTIGDGSSEMENLFNIIKDNVSKIGFNREEKRFIPHITIARMKFPVNFADLIENLQFKIFKNISCNKVILFESILSRKGPEYLIEKEFLLK